jgi:hypothetical protein
MKNEKDGLAEALYTRKMVVLIYNEKPTTAPCAVDGEDAFVKLDSNSGGYPYPVGINRAHDFKTLDAARKYAGMGGLGEFTPMVVEVTYKVTRA